LFIASLESLSRDGDLNFSGTLNYLLGILGANLRPIPVKGEQQGRMLERERRTKDGRE